ncbi:hypothetical protein C8R45DRAFT_942895 [Mycena sanguinolenta]|nr:hypothetical protein C8R45DRAFT_942895 [Mycena sanguinolenta]
MFHLTSRQLCAGMIFFIPASHWAVRNQAVKAVIGACRALGIRHRRIPSTAVDQEVRPVAVPLSLCRKQRRNGLATRRTEPVEPARRARRAALVAKFIVRIKLNRYCPNYWIGKLAVLWRCSANGWVSRSRLPATCVCLDVGPTQGPSFLGGHGNQEKIDRVNHGGFQSPDMADNESL